MQVVVVDDDHVGVAVKRIVALLGRTHRNGQLQALAPLGRFDGPHVGANALGRHHQPALDMAVFDHGVHGRQRDCRLASTDRRQHHGAVVLEQEVSGLLLVGS